MKNFETLINEVPSMDPQIQRSTKGGEGGGDGGSNTWHAIWNGVVGTTEVVIGVAGEELTLGASTYLIVDGASRVELAVAFGGDESMPTNMGGLIGYSVDGQEGMKWGSLTNDAITSMIGGSAVETWGDMMSALDTGDVGMAAGLAATFAGTINDSINYINTQLESDKPDDTLYGNYWLNQVNITPNTPGNFC